MVGFIRVTRDQAGKLTALVNVAHIVSVEAIGEHTNIHVTGEQKTIRSTEPHEDVCRKVLEAVAQANRG